MKKQKGFTLLEIMITVVIISILASIAWMSYQNYIVKARRVAASGCAMEMTQFMERFYTMNMRYDQTRGTAAELALPTLECATQISQFYTISVENLSATTYRVQAQPQGVQATRDSQCGTLTVDHTGKRDASGSDGARRCWS